MSPSSLDDIIQNSKKIQRKSEVSKSVPVKIDHTFGYSADYLRDYAGYDEDQVALYQSSYKNTLKFVEENKLKAHLEQFMKLFGECASERDVDNRNPDLVIYDLPSTMTVIFLGLAFFANCITHLASRLNSNAALRGFINALIPNSLPPHINYTPSSLYRMEAMFADSANVDEQDNNEDLYEFWQQVRLKPSIEDGTRTSYQATHGFLKGHTITSAKPFMDTYGGDGQELRASYMDVDGSPKKHFTSCSVYNCTRRLLADLRVKDKKNQERSAFKEIIANYDDLQGNVFMADALNTEAELYNMMQEKNIELILPVKANPSGKASYKLVKKIYNSVDVANCNGYQRFESDTNVYGNRAEKVIVEAIPVTDLEGIIAKNPAAFLDVNTNAFNKFNKVRTIIKKTKFTTIIGNKYSVETLNMKNKKSDTGEVHYYISSIELDEHGFKQILISLNEYWLCEQAHNTADTVIGQDYIASCVKSNTIIRVNFSRLIVDMLNIYKSKYNSNVKRKSHMLSYTSCRNLLADKLSARIECLCMFFEMMFYEKRDTPK